MRLAPALGLPIEENFAPGSPARAQFVETLEAEALRFLGSGGTVSLSERVGMTPLECEALRIAWERLAARLCAWAGLAAQGDHASVAALDDAGDTFVRQELEGLAASVMKAIDKDKGARR